jgi:hypothetical protein
VHRMYRTRHANQAPSWGPAPSWGQPLPGWSPLVDHGPLPLRLAESLGRWWWPILALTGFGIATGMVAGHDHPDPGLSTRSLGTIALAALVVVLLTVHRTAGPWPLTRALAEYAAVALLAALLVPAGDVDQHLASPATRAEARHAAPAPPKPDAGEDQPGVIRAGATLVRAVVAAAKAVAGAVRWVDDLWRQADAKTDPPGRSPTTTPKGDAMPHSPALASPSTRRPL